MTKVIIYSLADGRLCVCHPCISRNDPPNFTADDAVARALAKDIPEEAMNVGVIDSSELPVDRGFRLAWRQRGEKISVEIAIAREIRLAQLRAERDTRIEATDALIARATEIGDAAGRARLAAYRQALRDMPADVADALTSATIPEQLRAVRPTVLDEHAL